MAETEFDYPKDKVNNDEKIVRFILYPRDWNADLNELADGFFKLKNGEKGISCARYDYLGGQDATMERGESFAKNVTDRKRGKNPLAEMQKLKGWAHCKAQEIIDIDPDVIFLSIENPEKDPCHVEIRFQKDGDVVKGIVKDAYILELFDKIESTFNYVYW